MRQRLYTLVVFLVLASTVVGFPPAAALAGWGSTPDQDGGWTRAGVVGGGCDPQTGACDSQVKPGSPALFEYAPQRESVGRNGGAAPDHGGDPTYVRRQMCRYEGQDQGWSAGTWHHGAYWTLRIANGVRSWSGPSRAHWAFEHGDACRPLAPPPPTAVPATPTPPGGGPGGGGPGDPGGPGGPQAPISIAVTIAVHGQPPTPGTPATSGSGGYAPGARVRVSARYPSAWDQSPTWSGITYSGCGQSGRAWDADFAAPATGCTLQFVISFVTPEDPVPVGPTPTPLPPCFTDQGYPQSMPVQFSDPMVRAVRYDAPVTGLPDLPAEYVIGRVRARSLDVTLRPDQVRSTGGTPYNIYEPWHGGVLHVGLVDLGRDLTRADDDAVVLQLDGDRVARPMAGGASAGDDFGTQLTGYAVNSGVVQPLGPMTWHAYTTHSGGNWYEKVYWMNDPAVTGQPDRKWPTIAPDLAQGRAWIREPAPLGYRLQLQPGHYYDVLVQSGKKACGNIYAAYTRARFLAGEARTISGQVWDISNPDAAVPANAARHTISVEASVNGTTRLLDRQQSTTEAAAFNLVVARDDLDLLLRDAGLSASLTTPIQFRLHIDIANATFRNGTAVYYATDRVARAPTGITATTATARDVTWTASIAQMMARDWPGAAFYVGLFPYLPDGPAEQLFAHLRHADAGEPYESTAANARPDVFSWMYGAMLEVYPDVDLSVPPSAGAWPGYTVTATPDRWWYLGSPPFGAATDLRAIGAPVRVIWSKFPPPDARSPAVYAYTLPRIDGAHPPVLDVQIDYSYRVETPFGVPSEPMTDQVRGLLTAEQLAPQVVP